MRVWRLMELTGWRHLPSHVLDEPEWLLSDLLTISDMNARLEANESKEAANE